MGGTFYFIEPIQLLMADQIIYAAMHHYAIDSCPIHHNRIGRHDGFGETMHVVISSNPLNVCSVGRYVRQQSCN